MNNLLASDLKFFINKVLSSFSLAFSERTKIKIKTNPYLKGIFNDLSDQCCFIFEDTCLLQQIDIITSFEPEDSGNINNKKNTSNKQFFAKKSRKADLIYKIYVKPFLFFLT